MLEKFKKEITYCAFCPKLCRFACPVTNAEYRETVTPTVKMTFLKLLRDNAIDLGPDEADIFYRCLGCGLCKAYCKHRIDVGDIMIEARKLAVAGGHSPAPVKELIADLKLRVEKSAPGVESALGALKQERRINKTAKIIFYIGEEMLLRDPAAVAATIELMEYGGADFAVPGPELFFNGAASLHAGDEETFREAAKKTAAALNAYETVVCGDPDALYLFKEKYPEAGAAIKSRVVHTVEYALELLESSKLAFAQRSEETVMYHDPCKLARYLGVVDQPRKMLEKIYHPGNIKEFSWNKDKTYCCGGGGLVEIAAHDTAAGIARKRMREYREVKPDVLISACPVCVDQFRKFDRTIRVVDIATALASRLKK